MERGCGRQLHGDLPISTGHGLRVRLPVAGMGAGVLRVFYVGLTRARHEVHMLYSGWYEAKGRKYSNGPSEFLREVKQALSAG
jgi:hypothetical protein